MKTSRNKPAGYSLIFAIIVVVIVLIMVSGLSEIVIRNLRRTGDLGASGQAQSMANSAFGDAVSYVSTECEAGCNVTDGESIIEPDVIYGYYDILGIAGDNPNDSEDLYYVPIPGYGDTGADCGRDHVVGEPDEDSCNWNKIFYGSTVQIPLYVDGESMFGESDLYPNPDEFYIKVRTPLCEDGDLDCVNVADEGVERRLIGCLDGYTVTDVTSTLGGCASVDEDKVVMTWQIWGDRVGGSDYVEGYEDIREIGFGDEERDPNRDSEIYTTLINSQLNNDYVIIDISDIYAPWDGTDATIGDALGEMTNPILHLAFVQTIRNNDVPLPYLEYQIVSSEPISSDRSFIYAKGYTVSKGEKFFWVKEGSFSQYTDSLVNFVFQN